ncbi:hypothetical protein FRB94_013276 [Tulasnella sp. JGI-2019a]|nr:hypothetical protein FRB93_001982 [Tulasnella sp. JGI-2019a]KAG9008452.1 hypothetical protein FRB94_013276 [Tulasnella sp. JGI-2019a]
MGLDTLRSAKASLQILSAFVKAVPIPEPFKSAVVGIPDAVLQIISIVETAKGNTEDAKVLATYISTITDKTICSLDLPHATPATQNRISEFHKTLQQIVEEIATIASRRPLQKWINYDRDASTLSSLKQKVVDVITGIQLETVVATGHEVDVISRKQDFAHADQQAIIQQLDLVYQEQQVLIRKQQEAEIDRLISLLGSGDSGASKKPPCLEGTRASLLKWITEWIEAPPVDDRRGLCLIGAAGRGKSAVGASVAQAERTSKRLGADFYFMVDQQDRNMGVIPVLARQLASWGDERLRADIASALHEDRNVAQGTLEVQFKKLIQGPLETLADDPNCSPVVILLDGLDECNNEYAIRLLRLIGQSFATLPATVRFIIASRPEPHLLHRYTSEPLKARLHLRSLDLEQLSETAKDIEAYFRQELPEAVLGMVEMPNWPGEERILILVRMSGGLWIWATTVVRMLADQNFRDPEKQLDALLSSAPGIHGDYGHNADLYTIYSMILNRACPPTSHSKLITLFQDVLGVLCLNIETMNTYTLAAVLCLDELNGEDFFANIRTKVLGYLQAVLVVPDTEEYRLPSYAKPIQFIHKSFKDYLTDGSRSNTRFLVNIAEEHRRMAIRCLRHMEGLRKPDICDLLPTRRSSTKTPCDTDWRMMLEIPTLARLSISLGIQYACENWAIHVSCTPPECDDVHASVDLFVRIRLLYWLEALSLLAMTDKVIKLVELVEVWLEQARPQQVVPNSSASPIPSPPRRITTFITEGLLKMRAGTHLQTNVVHTPSNPLSLRALDHAKRFLADILPIQQPDASIQASILPKEPEISTLNLLRDLKNFILQSSISTITGPESIYHYTLPFTPSHTSLSRAYGHLAEGGPKPRRGCLEQRPLQTAQNCVAWSPDGQRIISGSEDGTLSLWDLSTGAPIGEAWKSHSKRVDCVAWSPDGKMVVSGSDDDTLQLWNPTTGARIGEALRGHTNAVLSVAWSPDSKWVVSGSRDKTLRMWDPSTGALIGEAWEGHTDCVWCVTWSPDSKIIASGSNDETIRLWESSMGVLIGKPWKAIWPAYSLAWSPDAKKIISASGYGICLWDAYSGGRIGDPPKRYPGKVRCVAWSPDGKTIASGCDGKTLSLWDASTGTPIGNAWKGHTSDVRSLAWSPDGRTIVSGSEDGAILWNSQTGEPLRLHQGGANSHTRRVYRLAFAPNSEKIVTASSDGTLRLWDTSSGELVGHPVRQTTTVTSLNFSLDGKYVISENEECRIIWQVAGKEIGLADDLLVGPIFEDHPCVLEIDSGGCVRDPEGKWAFWLPGVLRPIGDWGRVLVKGNILAIEVPGVPIIDISAYTSRF